MKHFYSLLIIVIFVISCSSPKKGNVTVTGSIKGLKKGTLYLQKIKDTVLINVDSVIIDGNSEFLLKSDVSEPEIHYLYLDKEDGAPYNDRIDFFAEPGEVLITTSLADFHEDLKIIGGENENKFQEYKKMNQRFKDRNLKLIKENFEANKQKDEERLIKNDESYRNLLKQKYLYTINFAVNNKNLEVAPYITINEISDTNVKFLDTIANSLSPQIQKSMYGKQLIDHIKKRKEDDKISAR